MLKSPDGGALTHTGPAVRCKRAVVPMTERVWGLSGTAGGVGRQGAFIPEPQAKLLWPFAADCGPLVTEAGS